MYCLAAVVPLVVEGHILRAHSLAHQFEPPSLRNNLRPRVLLDPNQRTLKYCRKNLLYKLIGQKMDKILKIAKVHEKDSLRYTHSWTFSLMG